MKNLLIAGLLLAAPKAFAQNGVYLQNCSQVSLSSSTATEMSGNQNFPRAFIWSIKVSNLDTTSDVCCSQDPLVSCTLGAHHGDLVYRSATPPFNYLSWIINYVQSWYCRPSSTTGPVNIELCTTSGVK